MRIRVVAFTVAVFLVLSLAASRPAQAQFYSQHTLVSDGAVPADLVDPELVNAWGLVSSSTSPWWVADNGTGLSTLYNGNTGAKVALTVTVPGNPTGIVFNGGTGFVVSNGSVEGPARFLFASEDGTISGWNPAVSPTSALVAVDESQGGAVFKGLAVATTPKGDLLYATDFHNGTVAVFDGSFKPVAASFADSGIPAGYAPFGIRAFGNVILVTYALQDADKHDDVPGQGHGYVDMFDTDGNLLERIAGKGQLNSPWGLALAPDNFGKFSGDLLVGNFGNGRIHAFDPRKSNARGEFQHRGPLESANGSPIVIDGLWALSFGNGASAGPANTLFFTAGPFEEQHGLFGKLEAVAPQEHEH
jgi:uncharacterized protein (TIGR03118 family)